MVEDRVCVTENDDLDAVMRIFSRGQAEEVAVVDPESRRGDTGGDSSNAMLTRFYEAAPQLVNGLTALHAAGRLHRDVKPPNVRVDRDGRVVILDFDLAAPIHEVGGAEGAAGELAGTLAYMAPEQLWGINPSPATDWYAVGVVFHEALTGRIPPRDPLTLSSAAPQQEVQLLETDPPLPEKLTKLIGALLDPEPSGARGGRDPRTPGHGTGAAPTCARAPYPIQARRIRGKDG